LKSASEFWSIAILAVFIAVCCTTATVSTIRRNRGRRPPRGADPVGWWAPAERDRHHGGGHHGGGHHGGGHHGGWGGGDGGGHHGGWSGGGDSGGGGGHHG
jgi:hypothetical protein